MGAARSENDKVFLAIKQIFDNGPKLLILVREKSIVKQTC